MSSKVSWAEKHPCPPDNKQVVKLLPTTISRCYGDYPHRIPTWMYLSSNLLTHAAFELSEGSHFEPADIHAGDELYYLQNGEIHVHQPVTGEVCKAEKGDVVHIPKGTPHVSYNFGNEEATVLTFFAPKIWPTAEDGLVLDNKLPGNVLLPGMKGGWKGILPSADSPFPASKELKKFPVDGPWSREQGTISVISEEKCLRFIHGKEVQNLVKIYVSNDYMTLGTFHIASNRRSDIEKSNGDKVIHLLKGRLTVEIEPEKRTGVSSLRFEMEEGEKLFIPENVTHQFTNFYKERVDILFVVAPEYL
jgi:mannose-6-phosphate isomerase-like protein (cupin superfamily)